MNKRNWVLIILPAIMLLGYIYMAVWIGAWRGATQVLYLSYLLIPAAAAGVGLIVQIVTRHNPLVIIIKYGAVFLSQSIMLVLCLPWGIGAEGIVFLSILGLAWLGIIALFVVEYRLFIRRTHEKA